MPMGIPRHRLHLVTTEVKTAGIETLAHRLSSDFHSPATYCHGCTLLAGQQGSMAQDCTQTCST